MHVYSSGESVASAMRGGVVALGNFDGFHAGHQAVVGRALARARAEGRPALVATFDPHPARLFRPDAAPFALTRLDQKLELFADFGIDATVVIPFNTALAALTAEAFVGDWLHSRIGAAVAVSGADFTFGTKRSGNTALLAELGQGHGFAAEVVHAVSDSGGVISSTRIRDALRGGEVAAATALLTRPYSIRGEVQHGAKLGRTLGFPTANLVLGAYLRPRFGVYAVRARLAERALDLGASFSVSGIVSFKGATDVREVTGKVPLERIILETDCPYLAPIPYRGRRNEPAYLVDVCRAFADQLGNRAKLVLRVLVELVFLIHALHRHVGGNRDDVHLVNVEKLGRFGRRRTGHAGELFVETEIVLEGDRGQRLVLGLDLHAFFGLYRLVQAV